MNRPFLRLSASALCLLLAATGCRSPFARRSDTVARMDAPRPREHKPVDTQRRDMIVEVTTDAQGNVTDIHFQRSSGRDGVDAYVAQTIHDGWPRQPSTRSVAEVTYSADKGFSQPRLLSSTPLQ